MKITPRTEADAQKAARRKLLPPGWHDAEITEAIEKLSKAGNPMIELTVMVPDADGNERTQRDWLTANDRAAAKVRHAAEAMGALAQHDAGELGEADFPIGHAVSVKISVQKGTRAYPGDKNVIEDYRAADFASSGCARAERSEARHMTAAERKRLAGLVGMLDSDQTGEREAALGKIHSLCGSRTYFADLLRASESAITPEQLEAVEKDRDEWMRAHDERGAENAALARRNTVLVARIVVLRLTLAVSSINWRRMAAVGAVIALSVGGWRWSNADAPPPDKSPVTAATAAADAAIDAGLRFVLAQTKWTDGDTSPVAWRMTSGGEHFWVVVRGRKDPDSHTDGRGHPIERHCLKLHATKAVQDAGAFLTPQPYAPFGLWMRWPLRMSECRSPGEKGYS